VVREHITAALTALDWHVEEDSFTDYTPYGQQSFTNIIATKDPIASRRVIVSAHYDSKFFSMYPENQVRSRQPLILRVSLTFFSS
jgi:glutaminyl-peptide cyclotransferase